MEPGTRPVPVDTQFTPLSMRSLLAVLGSMIVLIVALIVLLVQTTWVHPANAAESPPVLDQGSPGSR